MLREYQRQFNVSVWPGGIALHQETYFYTPPPSPLILIYLLAKLQYLQFQSVLKHAAYKEEVKEQREDADWGGKKLQLKTSPRDNLKGN